MWKVPLWFGVEWTFWVNGSYWMDAVQPSANTLFQPPSPYTLASWCSRNAPIGLSCSWNARPRVDTCPLCTLPITWLLEWSWGTQPCCQASHCSWVHVVTHGGCLHLQPPAPALGWSAGYTGQGPTGNLSEYVCASTIVGWVKYLFTRNRILRRLHRCSLYHLAYQPLAFQPPMPDIPPGVARVAWFRLLHLFGNPVDLCHPEQVTHTAIFEHYRYVLLPVNLFYLCRNK